MDGDLRAHNMETLLLRTINSEVGEMRADFSYCVHLISSRTALVVFEDQHRWDGMGRKVHCARLIHCMASYRALSMNSAAVRLGPDVQHLDVQIYCISIHRLPSYST